MPTMTSSTRVLPHAAGEPEELFGKFGEPLRRAVYSYRSPKGRELFVAVSAEGRVIASVKIPKVKESDPLTEQDFQHALGRAWIALEIADPCESPKREYPGLWTA